MQYGIAGGSVGWKIARGGGSVMVGANGQITYNVPAGQAHEFQVNEVAKLTLNSGLLSLASGVRLGVDLGDASNCAIQQSGQPNHGFVIEAGSGFTYVQGGGRRVALAPAGVRVTASESFSWAPGPDPTQSHDLTLEREAADRLAQKRGTNTQRDDLADTYTDSSNYRRLARKWSTGGVGVISPEAAGTGRVQVAVDGVISLGTTLEGFLFVVADEENAGAIIHFRGGGQATDEVSDPAGIFSVTKDTASSINLYWDAGNARYELQNKRASTITVHMLAPGALA